MNERLDPPALHDGALRLDEWALLRAYGADAATFLQGQLTQDVAGLAIGQARLAGYCSAKGRLLASFVVWRIDGDSFGLLCSADIAAAVGKRLSMYVLRARCRIEDLSARWAVWGMAGAAVARGAGAALPAWRAEFREPAWSIGLPTVDGTARALCVQPAQAAPPVQPAVAAAAWQWLEVSAGVPRIVAATAEQFVPQMVNFELVGGVSFQKGCYPGQEVVARSQYRGTLKRRMHLFATSATAVPGMEVFHSDDAAQPAGMVVNAAPLADQVRLLAEVKLAALERGTLHLASPQGAVLQQLALPYAIPVPADA
ncbi:MAG: folate-binding protein YgfZ [Ideonella sp.]|nr:folate-binding protein YgfZ [Ideonella sp.]MCC7457975.1 folate-binding protein YgfZ [Nitrospira sp.]